MTNQEMIDMLTDFLSQKQETTNKVFNDYFKAQSRIAELEEENKRLREELLKYGSREIL